MDALKFTSKPNRRREEKYIRIDSTKGNKDTEIKQIFKSYPNDIQSLMETKEDLNQDVCWILVLKGTDAFTRKYISKAKCQSSLLNLKDPNVNWPWTETNPKTSKNEPKTIEDYLWYYNDLNQRYKYLQYLQFKIDEREKYRRIWFSAFNEWCQKTEEKLIDKIFKKYAETISQRIQDANMEYYEICDKTEKLINVNRRNTAENYSFYYEFDFEEFWLWFCKIIHFYTYWDIKLELKSEKSRKVLLSWYSSDENTFDLFAEYFGYELQLKPYALKYEELWSLFIQEKNEEELKREKIEAKQANKHTVSIYSYQSKRSDKISKRVYETFLNKQIQNNAYQFHQWSFDNCLCFPPYVPFEKSKSDKFRKYLPNDDYHECKMDFSEHMNDCSSRTSKFRNIDKLRLSLKYLMEIINISSLYKHDVLAMLLYKRNYIAYGDMILVSTLFCNNANIFSQVGWMKTINTIRNFYGESISYYFLYVSFFSYWMLLPAFVGLIITFIVYNPPKELMSEKIDAILNFTLDYYDITLILFCLFITIWATLLWKAWKQYENLFRYIWGMEKYEKNKSQSDFFISDNTVPFILGETLKIVNPVKRALKAIFSSWILIAMILLRIGIVIYMFSFTPSEIMLIDKVKSNITSFNYVVTLSAWSGLATKVLGLFYEYLSMKLSKWENHETNVEQQNSFATKLIIFEFVNNYGTLIYIAFYKPYHQSIKCYIGNCLKELEISTYTLLLCNFVFTTLVLIWPFMLKRTRRIIHNVHRDVFHFSHYSSHSVEHQILCNRKTNLIKEYTQKMIRFGYVCLFSVGAPLTPLLVLLINYFENFADIYKIFNWYRIEIIDGSSGWHIYNAVFKIFYFIGMMTNICLVWFTSPKLANLDKYIREKITNNDDFIIKILIFAILENIMLCVMKMFNFSFNPIWTEHLQELKKLYEQRFYNRETRDLPHMMWIED